MEFTPPYIYCGLFEHEELMRQPDCDHHVRVWREILEPKRLCSEAVIRQQSIYRDPRPADVKRLMGLANMSEAAQAQRAYLDAVDDRRAFWNQLLGGAGSLGSTLFPRKF